MIPSGTERTSRPEGSMQYVIADCARSGNPRAGSDKPFFLWWDGPQFCEGSNSIGITLPGQQVTQRPWRRANHQHGTPDHGDGPSNSKANPTLAADHARSAHARPWWRAKHKHTHATMGAGQTPTQHARPGRRAQQPHSTTDRGAGPRTMGRQRRRPTNKNSQA